MTHEVLRVLVAVGILCFVVVFIAVTKDPSR